MVRAWRWTTQRPVGSRYGRQVDVKVGLGGGVVLGRVRAGDEAALAEGNRENRKHLELWEQMRDEQFFNASGQCAQIEKALEAFAAGARFPLMLADGARIVGRVSHRR